MNSSLLESPLNLKSLGSVTDARFRSAVLHLETNSPSGCRRRCGRLRNLLNNFASRAFLCVQRDVSEGDNSTATPCSIHYRYAADLILFQDPAALFQRHVRRHRYAGLTHTISHRQIERIESSRNRAADDIAI